MLQYESMDTNAYKLPEKNRFNKKGKPNFTLIVISIVMVVIALAFVIMYVQFNNNSNVDSHSNPNTLEDSSGLESEPETASPPQSVENNQSLLTGQIVEVTSDAEDTPFRFSVQVVVSDDVSEEYTFAVNQETLGRDEIESGIYVSVVYSGELRTSGTEYTDAEEVILQE